MDLDGDFEQELRLDFIAESLEGLDRVEASLLALSQASATPDGAVDAEQVADMFRHMHSLKGNAALFSCTAMQQLGHAAEDLLDALRQGHLAPEEQIIAALYAAVDCLRSMLHDLRQGQLWPPSAPQVQELERQLWGLLPRGGDDAAVTVAARLRQLAQDDSAAQAGLAGILEELADHLQPVTEACATTPLARLRSILAEPLEQELADDQSTAVAQDLASLAQAYAAAGSGQGAAVIDECLEAYETFTQTVGFDEVLRDYLWQRVATLPELATATAPTADAGGSTTATINATAATADKTMRVREEHVDTFLAYVGDLLVIGDTLHHLQRRLVEGTGLAQLPRDFRRANETFQQLSAQLQQSIMAIRQLPAETLLRRAPRLVRELAQEQGKSIMIDCSGEDIYVDKSLIELLDAPLTHLLRNAVDHGIEDDAQRRAAGKALPARLQLQVSEHGDSIKLMLSDDGRGLDVPAIRAAGLAKGLLRPEDEMDEAALRRVIFSPGLSTAREVSDISGRGVGLDVVQRNLLRAGGSLQLATAAGAGTTFTITLPRSVTTQIINGFLVAVDEQILVLPLDRVHGTIAYDCTQLHRVEDCHYALCYDDSTVAVLSLAAIFDSAGAQRLHDQQRQQVAVRCHGNHGADCAMVVDRVIGVQQVVLRPIDGIHSASGLIAGGALLGDGTVSLIIDVEALCAEHLGQPGMVGA